MPHIFLSYRSIEADFALKLASDLKNAGVDLWMDRLDGIRGGDDWRNQIEAALNPDQCALMIAVLSPDYLTADYCRNELARADRLKIPVLPLLLYPVQDIPIEIERVQHIPFCDLESDKLVRTWREESLYVERLRHVLDKLPEAQKGRIPDAETQYLNSLIADLESRKGVMEYVELSAQADVEATRPEPHLEDEWAAGFSLLVGQPSIKAVREPSSYNKSEKITLNSIADALEKYPRFVLIGEPGAGKTTTLRRLALDAAHKRLENPRIAPLPLFLYLPQWADESTPLDFVRKHWPFTSDPVGLLASGDITLYLDGLNEMGGTGGKKAQKLREWFGGKDTPQRVIVTCRAGDYTGDLKLNEMPTVQAEELDEGKIQQFAKRYLGLEAKGFLSRILPPNQGERENQRSLFRLAQNPYLLAALVFVYINMPDGDLPRNNGSLMRALANALWERERQKQTPGWIPFEEMEEQFGKLAFEMIKEAKPIDVPMQYALQQVLNEELVRLGHSANLVEIRGNEVRFYHQLMQEYFAAIGLGNKGLTSHLHKSDFHLGSRIVTQWDEVFTALCGIHDKPTMLIRQILKIDPYLAAYCSASIPDIPDDLSREIMSSIFSPYPTSKIAQGYKTLTANTLKFGKSQANHLLTALNNEDWRIRYVAIKVLKELGDSRVVSSLRRILDNTPDWDYLPLEENNITVLVADDNRNTLRELVEVLVSYSNRFKVVGKVTNGFDAYDLALSRQPDIIFMNATMPKMDGFEASSEILGEIPEATIVITSAANTRWSRQQAFAAGACEYVTVPFSGSDLIDTVENLLFSPVKEYEAAIEALAWLGDTTDEKVFRKALEYNNTSVNRVAAEALTRIGTSEALAAVEKWQMKQERKK